MKVKMSGVAWLIMGIILFAGISVSQADLIASYNLNSSSFAVTVEHPDISASSVGAPGDWTISGTGGNLVINGAANIPTGAPDLAEYVMFRINPLESTVNYSTVGVDFGGENFMSATPYTVTIQLRSSADNYGSVLGSDSYIIPANTTVTSLESASFDLSGISALQNTTSVTEFRFYVYDNSDVTTKTLRARVDNIAVEGSVVPEPATIGMLGLGSLIALSLRRLRS